MNSKLHFISAHLGWVVASLLLVIFLATKVVQGSGTIVYACVNIGSGTVRIVDQGTLCNQNETPLSWNTGGSGVVSGMEVVSQSTPFLLWTDPSTSYKESAFCSPGKKVTGGGGKLRYSIDGQISDQFDTFPDHYLAVNEPANITTQGASGWTVGFNQQNHSFPDSAEISVTAYAICVNAD